MVETPLIDARLAELNERFARASKRDRASIREAITLLEIAKAILNKE